ncbi:MAG TPA: hypothetical protein VHB99_12890, partial [Pirellulales bacterium]|nr:hypothetical protein [Pirellulales bacterium]
EAAKAYYQDGLGMRRKLVDAKPGDARARRELAVFCERLCDVGLKTGQIEEALQFARESLDLRRQLAERAPKSALAQHELSITQCSLARVERQRFDYEAAQAQCRQAKEAIARALELGRRQDQLELITQNVDQLSTECAKAAIAVAGFEQIEQAEAADRAELYAMRASELARRGDVAAVAETAEKLGKLAGENADRLYDAACGYSLCVRVFDTPPRGGVFQPRDPSQPLSPEELKDRQKYATLALETLDRAVKSGFKSAAKLRQDQDLIPLRELPEFKKLLESLAES